MRGCRWFGCSVFKRSLESPDWLLPLIPWSSLVFGLETLSDPLFVFIDDLSSIDCLMFRERDFSATVSPSVGLTLTVLLSFPIFSVIAVSDVDPDSLLISVHLLRYILHWRSTSALDLICLRLGLHGVHPSSLWMYFCFFFHFVCLSFSWYRFCWWSNRL